MSGSRPDRAIAPTKISCQPGRVEVESADEYSLAVEVRPGLVAFHFEGWTSDAHIEPACALIDASLAKTGRVVVITNGDGCDGCDEAVRTHWTSWTKRNKKAIDAQHYLAPSAMMRMGLRMMAMLSGVPLEVYRNVAEFEKVVAVQYPAVDLPSLRRRR